MKKNYLLFGLLFIALLSYSFALPPQPKVGRVKLEVLPATSNPSGTYHKIFGSTNSAHMQINLLSNAPVKVTLKNTNICYLTNLQVGIWYFVATANYSNNMSIPTPVLQVFLVEPPKGMSNIYQIPSNSFRPSTTQE